METGKNRVTQLILLDLKKAFDSVWHDTFVYKLHIILTPTVIINLIKSYLDDRKMFVSINDARFDIHLVKAGVSQGSILGPTLFNIYINDIPATSNTQFAIYADDTAIYTSSWSLAQAIKYLQNHVSYQCVPKTGSSGLIPEKPKPSPSRKESQSMATTSSGQKQSTTSTLPLTADSPGPKLSKNDPTLSTLPSPNYTLLLLEIANLKLP